MMPHAMNEGGPYAGGRALCGREAAPVSVSLRPITVPSCCVLNDLGDIPGDTLMPLVLYHVCMRACPEALFWRSGRINGERERDLLCDADDKRDKGGDEGREAEGGGLIKSKARQGGARRSLVVALVTGARLISPTGRRPERRHFCSPRNRHCRRIVFPLQAKRARGG